MYSTNHVLDFTVLPRLLHLQSTEIKEKVTRTTVTVKILTTST